MNLPEKGGKNGVQMIVSYIGLRWNWKQFFFKLNEEVTKMGGKYIGL